MRLRKMLIPNRRSCSDTFSDMSSASIGKTRLAASTRSMVTKEKSTRCCSASFLAYTASSPASSTPLAPAPTMTK